MLSSDLEESTPVQPNFRSQPFQIQLIILGFASVTGIIVSISDLDSGQAHASQSNLIHPVQIAQSVRRIQVQEIGLQVYQRLPDLPRENRYISQETGEVAENDTLIQRLIRYHLYTKGRSPLSRFDWKLTVADYLGVNEVMSENQYPSGNRLNENPMLSDREVISSLTRAERNDLVNAIVELINPNLPSDSSPQPATRPSEPSPEQSSPRTTPLPPQPKPGDADLLK
jgi:hypothetical protein